MNGHVVRARALALAIAAGPGACAGAAAASGIEEIIVTSPVHRGAAETALPVNVIDADKLRRNLAATLGETLKREIGITYASFGPGVGQPVIRGQGAPRVLVLANSLPVADASGTSRDHANAAEAVLAERIEILRGPATLLFGSGAIGGVVNVIDTRVPDAVPETAEGALEARASSNAAARVLAGRLETGTGKLALHLDGFQRENDAIEIPGSADIDGEGSRGQISNSAADAASGTVGASWMLERGFVGLAVNRLESEYGIPDGAHGHGHDDEHEDEDEHEGELEEEDASVRIDLEQTRYDLRAELEQPFAGVERLRGYLARTDYQHRELEGGAVGTTYNNNSWDGRIEAVHGIGPLHGALGLQFGARDFRALGEEAFVPDSESDSWGVFLVEDLHRGALLWELGLRYGRDEHNPAGGSARAFNTGSVSLSALWELDAAQSLKFSLSRAQRAPAPEELFSDGVHVATRSYEIGNGSLDPETSLGLDLGYHYHGERLGLRIEGFANRYEDYIYQEYTDRVYNLDTERLEGVCRADDEDECLPVLRWSASDADFIGLEAELILDLGSGFELTVSGDVVRGELDGGGAVPRMPPARIGSALGWSGGPWDMELGVMRAFDQDRPGANEPDTRGYTALAARAEYRTGGWVLFLRAENLLDEEIRNATSLLRDIAPEAGRSIEGGVRLVF